MKNDVKIAVAKKFKAENAAKLEKHAGLVKEHETETPTKTFTAKKPVVKGK